VGELELGFLFLGDGWMGFGIGLDWISGWMMK